MKNIAKILAVVMAFALLSIGLVAFVNAEDTGKLVVTASETTLRAGDEFTVTVSLEDNPGIYAVAFDLFVDNDTFKYVEPKTWTDDEGEEHSSETEGCLKLPLGIKGFQTTIQAYRFNGVKSSFTSNLTANGKLVNITYKVADNAKPGTYELHLVQDVANTINIDSEKLTFTTTDATVTIVCDHTTTELDKSTVKEAKCNEDGYTGDTVCAVCGEVVEYGSVISKDTVPHTPVVTKEAKDPSCIEEGWTAEETCSVCDTVTKASETLEKTAHTPKVTKEAKEPSCTEEGWTAEESCSVCDTVTKASETLPMTAHETELQNKKDATCTEKGYTGDEVCKNCGQKITAGTDIDTIPHDKNVVKNDKAPTCTEKGYTGDLYCSMCDTLQETGEDIDMIAHDKNVVKNAVDPTCTTEGYSGDLYCSMCDTLQETGEVLAVIDHNKDVVKGYVAPTCTTEGYSGDLYCSMCDELQEEGEVLAVIDHDKNDVRDAKDATCVDEGYTGDLYCSMCGELQEEGETIPATGEHTYENGICTVCGAEDPNAPADDDGNGDNNGSDVPVTGDNNAIYTWLTLLAISVIGIAATIPTVELKKNNGLRR